MHLNDIRALILHHTKMENDSYYIFVKGFAHEGLISSAVKNGDDPEIIERFALVDLVSKEYQLFSEYELRNGLVNNRWLNSRFVTSLLPLEKFLEDEEIYGQIRALLANAGCGFYVRNKLEDPEISCVIFGKGVKKDRKFFTIPNDWRAWADISDLSEVESARYFGIGAENVDFPGSVLNAVDTIIRSAFDNSGNSVRDYFVRIFPRGWMAAKPNFGNAFETAFRNLKCKDFRPVEGWSFTKMIAKVYNIIRN